MCSNAFARRVKDVSSVLDVFNPKINLLYELLKYSVGAHGLIATEQSGMREIPIPAVITDEHQGLVLWLQEQGLKNVVVINLDAHRDYRDTTETYQDTTDLHSGNWVRLGKEQECISDAYWLVPPWVEVTPYRKDIAAHISSLNEVPWDQYKGETIVVSIDLDSFSNRLAPRHRIPLDQVVSYLNEMAELLIENDVKPIFHITPSPIFTYAEDVPLLQEAIFNAFSLVYAHSED
ncbi:MAG: hypothetical protein P9X27_03580 [Candidatus Kaelpia aquatica]|nr:hypothetical protein [Candidatus Kaelpia aquatica]